MHSVEALLQVLNSNLILDEQHAVQYSLVMLGGSSKMIVPKCKLM